jgi:hypothetical protein
MSSLIFSRSLPITSSPFVLGFKENILNTEIGKASGKKEIYEIENEIDKSVICKGTRERRILREVD